MRSWLVVDEGDSSGSPCIHYAIAVKSQPAIPTLTESLQSQVAFLKEELGKERAHNELLLQQRVNTDRDLPPSARTQANLWQARYFEAQRELSKANKGLRRQRAAGDRMKVKLTALKDRVEDAECALGNHPDSNTDLANEISRLRYENREHFHAYTKVRVGISTTILHCQRAQATIQEELKKNEDTTLLDIHDDVSNAIDVLNAMK